MFQYITSLQPNNKTAQENNKNKVIHLQCMGHG